MLKRVPQRFWSVRGLLKGLDDYVHSVPTRVSTSANEIDGYHQLGGKSWSGIRSTASKLPIDLSNHEDEIAYRVLWSHVSYHDLARAKRLAEARHEQACLTPASEDVVERLKKMYHSGEHLQSLLPFEIYQEAVKDFVACVELLPEEERASFIITLQQCSVQDFIQPLLLRFIEERYKYEVEDYIKLIHSKDLSDPHHWFPLARALQRKIIYHSGPTNSGKTYNALQAMKNADSGVYCGPLRLLAMEVYESCNIEGTHCTLVTGQERREVPGATHTSCTVEMINLNKRVDVAVIDEIQVIGDSSRGWAWTRALLGIPAAEIHVCGDGSAAELVEWIAQQTGDDFEIREYTRFTPLEIESGSMLNNYSSVRSGDCIVAFSRYDIFQIKSLIEAETSYKACVVYGALPPETRRQQAKLFNDPHSGYDIMIASDAVGMGLNLNIGRIVFHKMEKREGFGKEVKPVSVTMVKQFAGRAGRRSSQFKKGKATCFDKSDILHLQKSLNVPLHRLATPKAGLYPEFEHFKAFADSKNITSFSELLKEFHKHANLHEKYFFCGQECTVDLAKLLERLEGLTLEDMYYLCMAPASVSDLRIAGAMLHFAQKYASGDVCELEINPGSIAPTTAEEMRDFETAHQVATLWLWLSQRFGEPTFSNRENALKICDKICRLLAQGLENITKENELSPKATKGEQKLSSGNKAAASSARKFPDARKCRSAKQLFAPFKNEFFLLLNEHREKQDERS